VYGSEEIAAVLQRRGDLEEACLNTLKRSMTEMGLKSRVSKAFKPTTTSADPTKKPAPHVLDRDFEAAAPNTKWVTDIT
jgi:putative transposase